MEKIIKRDSGKIIITIGNLLKLGSHLIEFDVFSKSQVELEMSGYDNWDGGTYSFSMFCRVPIELYSKVQNEIPELEETIKNKAQHVFKSYERCWVGQVLITPQIDNLPLRKIFQISNEDLLLALEQQKNLMVSVSTGGPKIQLVNGEYVQRNKTIEEGFAERNIKNTIVFADLWRWHGKWSDGSLPAYRDRREFLAQLFDPIIECVRKIPSESTPVIFEEPTGWNRVDRSMREIRARLALAETEEQFQGIGLLCRETLMSLAQAVFVKEKHTILDGTDVSNTDAKRMLEAFIACELSGASNEVARKMAKASVDLANTLTHRRTADFRLAAFSAEVTNSVVNVFSILEGRRDPS
ncbi:MAG: hypothetical protein HOP07_06600 [Bacteriovoracaceae bacterium]|nr:hypothetical protein [Bacteriovoracaceae bacterium]